MAFKASDRRRHAVEFIRNPVSSYFHSQVFVFMRLSSLALPWIAIFARKCDSHTMVNSLAIARIAISTRCNPVIVKFATLTAGVVRKKYYLLLSSLRLYGIFFTYLNTPPPTPRKSLRPGGCTGVPLLRQPHLPPSASLSLLDICWGFFSFLRMLAPHCWQDNLRNYKSCGNFFRASTSFPLDKDSGNSPQEIGGSYENRKIACMQHCHQAGNHVLLPRMSTLPIYPLVDEFVKKRFGAIPVGAAAAQLHELPGHGRQPRWRRHNHKSENW